MPNKGPSIIVWIKRTAPIALGLLLVFLTYRLTSPENRSAMMASMQQVNLFWLLVSVALGVISHLSRAIRWNYLLAPMGYRPSIMANALIIMMAYLTNLGIPRSGELLRATTLKTYQGVPFQKGFGTIVTERIIDLLMLFVVILGALALQTEVLLDTLADKNISLAQTGGVLAALIVGGYFGLRWIQRTQIKPLVMLREKVGGLLEGSSTVFHMNNKAAFWGHTALIWGCYVAMFWVVKFALPDTQELALGPILVAFVAGAFAMTATNGGIGLYPIAVQQSLMLFGVSAASGLAFGWVMWLTQTLLVVVIGAASFILIPFVGKSNSELAGKP